MLSKTILSLLTLLANPAIPIDRIAATVNEEIITLSDIQKATQFFPVWQRPGVSPQTLEPEILNDLINHKAIYLEYKDEFTLNEEDYERIQTPIIEKIGSLEKLIFILEDFDMEWDDFRDFIEEKVFFEKVIREKFQMRITIQFSEIEEFYQKEYRPMQAQLQIEAKSLVEMTPSIEKYLRQIKTSENLVGWLNDVKSSYKIAIK